MLKNERRNERSKRKRTTDNIKHSARHYFIFLLVIFLSSNFFICFVLPEKVGPSIVFTLHLRENITHFENSESSSENSKALYWIYIHTHMGIHTLARIRRLRHAGFSIDPLLKYIEDEEQETYSTIYNKNTSIPTTYVHRIQRLERRQIRKPLRYHHEKNLRYLDCTFDIIIITASNQKDPVPTEYEYQRWTVSQVLLFFSSLIFFFFGLKMIYDRINSEIRFWF